MAHVKLSGYVRRRHHNGKRFFVRVYSGMEISFVQPFLIQSVLESLRIVGLCEFFAHEILLLCWCIVVFVSVGMLKVDCSALMRSHNPHPHSHSGLSAYLLLWVRPSNVCASVQAGLPICTATVQALSYKKPSAHINCMQRAKIPRYHLNLYLVSESVT